MGENFQKSEFLTFLQFIRARAAHQPHVGCHISKTLFQVLERLIEAGANVNEANAHKQSPLHLAAQNGHTQITQLLVQAGADLDFKDLIGNTPLHTAFHNSHTGIAKYLVASGANEFSRNLAGLTPSQLGR